ncbi:hypothetical protein HALO156_110048 [Halomonas sp. 156]|nr:hypothetical protein HALO156_110048 [Halomonas sp. 156]
MLPGTQRYHDKDSDERDQYDDSDSGAIHARPPDAQMHQYVQRVA